MAEPSISPNVAWASNTATILFIFISYLPGKHGKGILHTEPSL